VTEGASTEGSNDDQSQKKGLNLSIAMDHLEVIDTSIGRVFLFPLRVSDTRAYAKLPNLSSIQRIRGYLPCIASLSAYNSLDHRRLAITAEQVDQLSDDEIEALAEAYASSSEFRETEEETDGKAPVSREPGETATAYLDRLLRYVVDEREKRSRKIMESVVGSTQSIFDQVRKSSLELGDSWRQLERLTKQSAIPKSFAPAFETKSLKFSNDIVEHTARIARERAEDRELLRLTADTSAKSAKTLQELADAASTMLDKLDKRDVDAKRTTMIQLWIAVGSVVVSAFLAGATFLQDFINNESSDNWQSEILSEIRRANDQGGLLQLENQMLREQIHQLSNSVLELQGKAGLRSPTKD